MIKLGYNDKNLVVPSGLGFGGAKSGGGSGGGVSPQEAREIAEEVVAEELVDYVSESALTETLEDYALRTELSAYTTDNELQQALQGYATTAQTQAISDSLSNYATTAQTAEIAGDVEELSGATQAIEESLSNYATTADTASIREAVSGISEALQDYATTATTEALAGQISGVSGDVQELSGVTADAIADIATLSGQVATKQDAEYVLRLSTIEEANFTQEDTQAISDLFAYLADKTSETANVRAVNENDDTIIFRLVGFSDSYAEFTYFSVEIGAIGFVVDPNGGCTVTEFDSQQVLFDLTLKQDELNPSSGISIDASNNISVKVGDGLGFSGDTLVVSGATGGGPRVILLNDLSQQERVALYNELRAYYDDQTGQIGNGYDMSQYEFYYDASTNSQMGDSQLTDNFQGWFPMNLSYIHPSDYGGAIFFDGVQQIRQGNAILKCLRYVITYDGQVDGPSTWTLSAQEPTQYYRDFYITSGGTIAQGHCWEIYNNERANTFRMRYDSTSGGYNDTPSVGYFKWMRSFPIEYNGEEKWYHIWSADILIDNVMYTGVWDLVQDQWCDSSTRPPQCLSWTSGATYTLSYQPMPAQ